MKCRASDFYVRGAPWCLSLLCACAPVSYELIRADPAAEGGGGAGGVGAGAHAGAMIGSGSGGVAGDQELDTWLPEDIGPVTGPGEVVVEEGRIVLRSGGGRDMPADHGSEEDAFFLVHRPWRGDLDAVVQVLESSGQAGIMLREGSESLARYVMSGLRGERAELVFQYRPVAGQRSPVPLKVRDRSAPVWLRLVRLGSELTGYHSFDGATWERLGDPIVLELQAELQLGLFLALNEPAEAHFSELDVSLP